MFNDIRIYSVPLVASACIHLGALGFLSNVFAIPDLMRAPATPPIHFEIVDNPHEPQMADEVLSRMLDEQNHTAKDRHSETGDETVPYLDGTDDEKELITADFSTQVASQPAQPSEAAVRELTEQIRKLQQLNQELLDEKRELEDVLDKEEDVVAQEATPQPVTGMSPSTAVYEQKVTMKNLDSHVREMGEPFFAARADVLAKYHKDIRDAVAKIWYPTMAVASPMPDSRVVVEFKVLPDGDIEDLTVLSKQGSYVFADFCVMSIQKASPFDPIPIEFPAYRKAKYLTIVFPFEYN